MTMRTYSGLLVLENLFDYIPTNNPDIGNFATTIFNPNVQVVQADCLTTLGSVQNVNYELEGNVELATGLPLSKSRIDQLLFHGIYKISTRTLNTCVAPGGICQACYAASRPRLAVPAVGTSVVVYPEYVLGTTVIPASIGQTVCPLKFASTAYTDLYVYIEGVLLSPSSYTVSGNFLTLTTPMATLTNVTIHYIFQNRAPFLVWLASTYAGSLLGMKPLPSPMLPIRSQLLTSIIPQNRLELLVSYTNTITKIPEHFRTYCSQIKHPLEKALYLLAVNSIFANVPS